MAFCAKCGAQLAAGATFCTGCGTAQGSSGGGGSAAAGAGLEENLAGLLCYAIFWITGIIFFVIDKRPFVRFHAAQSLVLFGALSVIYWGLDVMLGMFGGIGFWSLYSLVIRAVQLVGFICWILCMLKAYQHERFKLPFVGDIAENIAGK